MLTICLTHYCPGCVDQSARWQLLNSNLKASFATSIPGWSHTGTWPLHLTFYCVYFSVYAVFCVCFLTFDQRRLLTIFFSYFGSHNLLFFWCSNCSASQCCHHICLLSSVFIDILIWQVWLIFVVERCKLDDDYTVIVSSYLFYALDLLWKYLKSHLFLFVLSATFFDFCMQCVLFTCCFL